MKWRRILHLYFSLRLYVNLLNNKFPQKDLALVLTDTESLWNGLIQNTHYRDLLFRVSDFHDQSKQLIKILFLIGNCYMFENVQARWEEKFHNFFSYNRPNQKPFYFDNYLINKPTN